MTSGASASVNVNQVSWMQQTKESIQDRHNAWNKWTVETLHLNRCCGDFLKVRKDSGMVATVLKVAALFILSHLVGPLVSTLKSVVKGCYNGTTTRLQNCWNKCCCKNSSKPTGNETETTQKKGCSLS